MLRLVLRYGVTISALGVGLNAGAQSGVEQISPPVAASQSGESGVQQVGPRENAVGVPAATPADAERDVDQITRSGERSADTIAPPTRTERGGDVAQASKAGDRQIDMPAPPPELVDACEAAALGRAPAPEGIDCNSVLVADARTRPADLSELAALRGTGEDIQSGDYGSRLLEGADPEEIARRLASGFLVNAPAAQNVGANHQQENGSTLPGGVQVIPDPSRPESAPVQVNPQ